MMCPIPFTELEYGNITIDFCRNRSYISGYNDLISNQTVPNIDSALGAYLRGLYFWSFGVVLCAVAVIGVLTNIINVYALGYTLRSHRRPMYHFLICIAAVDLLIMMILLVRTIRFYLHQQQIMGDAAVYTQKEGLKVEYATYVFFHTWYIAVNILTTLSNWATVAMGMFRLTAVLVPLKASTLCTVRRAQITLVCLSLLSIIINLPAILEIRVVDGIFSKNSDADKYNIISMAFTVPVPILACLITNMILIKRLKDYRSGVKHLFEGRNHRSYETNGNPATSLTHKQNTNAELTLISVSLFYVIMSVPNVAYFSALYLRLLRTLSPKSLHIFYIISNMAIYINHACNFFFYVFIHKPFRNLLWQRLKFSKPESNHTRMSTISHTHTSLRTKVTDCAASSHLLLSKDTVL